jgi:hypothetical protein
MVLRLKVRRKSLVRFEGLKREESGARTKKLRSQNEGGVFPLVFGPDQHFFLSTKIAPGQSLHNRSVLFAITPPSLGAWG